MKRFWDVELDKVLPDKPDIIVLPEKCDRPRNTWPSVSNVMEYYIEQGEQMFDFFRQKAKDNGCCIAYSAVRRATDGKWRNSTQIINRNGGIEGIYDKCYPTIPEIEEHGIEVGNKVEMIQCDFGKVTCAICFDILFDELRREYADTKQEIILYSSMMHGLDMANYWAYSCQAYVVGSFGVFLPGYVISPLGKTIAMAHLLKQVGVTA